MAGEGGGESAEAPVGRLAAPSCEALFMTGESLERAEIEARIARSGLVRRTEDEFFRLVKRRFFKRVAGRFVVREGA